MANCLAGFLLTRKLLLLLMASPAACVVNVALAGQQEIDFSDVVLRQQSSGQRAHRQSKLAQILIPIDLAGEFEGSGVSVNALHPATFMNTSMIKRAGIVRTSRVEDGGEAILHLATVPALASHTGRYFEGLRRCAPTARHMTLRPVSGFATSAWR